MIDTDILINLIKSGQLIVILDKYDLYISIITLYEYLRGLKILDRNIIEAKGLLEKSFSIILLDNKVINCACNLYKALRSDGLLIDDRDLLIAASAIAFELPLWTGNVKHFSRLEKYGLRIWKEN